MKFIFRRPGLSTYIFFSFVCFVIAFKSWEEASWHFGYTNWALCCPMLFVLKKLKMINKTTLRSCHVNTAWLCSCHYSGKTEHLWNSSRRKQDILCTCIYRGNWKLRHQNHTGREELLALFQSRGFGNVCSFLFVSPDIPLLFLSDTRSCWSREVCTQPCGWNSRKVSTHRQKHRRTVRLKTPDTELIINILTLT